MQVSETMIRLLSSFHDTIQPMMSQYFMCLPNNSCGLQQTVAFLLRPVDIPVISIRAFEFS